ncbi:MAG: hypothetical protein WAU57_09800 [Xanthobacteraceae bacterium]
MEESQDPAQRDLVDEALYLRGRLIACYAQVEFLFADLITKLEDRFAYRIESRIKGVRAIAEMPGYEAYRHDLHRLADELLLYEDYRHYMVHGFMRAEVDRAGNHRFQLLRYTREDVGKYKLMQATTNIQHMKESLNDMDSYVKDVMNLFERIYREKKLEPMAPEDGKSSS